MQFSLVKFASHGVKCSFPQGLDVCFLGENEGQGVGNEMVQVFPKR